MTEDAADRQHVSATSGAVKDKRPEIHGYDILEKLAETESAVTWKARQQSLDRMVTVKVLKQAAADAPDVAARFLSEARAIAQLKSSGLIHVYDVDRHQGACCFIMEHVDGESLSARLKRDRNLPQKKALDVALAVAETLDSCWDANKIAHLDMQPDNIILSADQLVKVANIGMSRLTQSTVSGDPSERGNAHYMAPEQFMPAAKPDFRADMYSLGAVLYHMLTGLKPFDGKGRALAVIGQQEEQIPDPRDVNPSLSIGATQLIARLMMKEPQHRYGSWAGAIAALKKVQAGKVLLHRQGKARSTVAMSTTVGPATRASNPTTGPATREYRPATGPANAAKVNRAVSASPARYPMLRLVLRAGLITWCIGLGYVLLGLPPKPVLTRLHPTNPPTSSVPVVPTMTSTAPTTTLPPTVLPDPPTLEPPATDVSPVPNRTAGTPPEGNASVHPAVGAVAQTVARHVLAEDYDAALSTAERALRTAGDPSEKAGMQTLRDIAAYLDDLSANVQEAFRKQIGTPSDLNYSGVTATINITAVNGDKVAADIITHGASVTQRRSTVFRISALDPQERARWLGPITSPPLAAAHYVLAMQAGDFVGAQAAAAQAGPLADALSEQAEARIRLLTE